MTMNEYEMISTGNVCITPAKPDYKLYNVTSVSQKGHTTLLISYFGKMIIVT